MNAAIRTCPPGACVRQATIARPLPPGGSLPVSRPVGDLSLDYRRTFYCGNDKEMV
jgi:hypothetical protein